MFFPTSRDADNLEGKNPSCAIFDEAALIDRGEVFSNIRTAMGARDGKHLEVVITTAQGKLNSPFMGLRKHAIRVLAGEVEDEEILPFLYELDDDDDPFTDESCWPKANPNLGVSVRPEFLRGKVREAKAMPNTKADIANKHFNMWLTNRSADWIPVKDWDACARLPAEIEKNLAGTCYIGVDLASVSDLCAVVKVYQQGASPRLYVHPHFWISMGTFSKLDPEIKMLYEQAHESGLLTINDGHTTDVTLIEDYIFRALDEEVIGRIGVDPSHAQSTVNRIENEYPDAILIVRPHRLYMSPGITEMERQIKDGNLLHDGNGFMRWQFQNMVLDKDPKTELCLIDKDRDEEKIDGFTALAVAMRCVSEPGDIFASSQFYFSSIR